MDNIQDNFEKINEYINFAFSQVNDYKGAIKSIERLTFIMAKYKYTIKVDTIIDLIEKNSNYSRCVEIIFNRNKKQIIDGKVDRLFKNGLLISSIDVYCMINNIEVKDNIEDYEFNSKDMDGFSMYIDDIKNNKVLTYEEEQELFRKLQQGDEEAKRFFVESNLKLVVKIARMYRDRGLSLQDLIQEGNLGLLTAIDKFDPDRGYRFSTYAYNWIKQSMSRALANFSRTIRYPVHLIEKYNRFLSVRYNLFKTLHREPTIEEIAKKLNMSVDKVNLLAGIQTNTTSLESLIGEDKDAELGSVIPDPNVNVEDEVIERSLKEDIDKLLNNGILKPREIEVLKYRFGFDGYEQLTLSDIGDMYGITRERVRQIEDRALAKLRKCHDIIHFESFKLKPDEDRENRSIIDQNSLRYKYIIGKKNKDYLSEYKTIYQILSKYSKSKIDYVFSLLNDSEKKLVIKMFGDDFNLPYIPTISPKEESKYYREVLPKMKRILKSLYDVPTYPSERVEEMSKLLSDGLKEKEIQKQKEIEEVTSCLLQTYVFEPETKIILDKLKNVLIKEDYDRLYELMVLAKQNPFLSKVTDLELIILFLSLGYVNNKYFMFDDLTKYLEMSEDRIREVVKKSLQQYQNDVVNSMDEIMNSNNKKLSLTK